MRRALEGLTFRLLGRFETLPAARLRAEIVASGGRIGAGGNAADYVAVGHRSIRAVRDGSLFARLGPGDACIIGETRLLRMLGRAPEAIEEARDIAEADILRMARIDRDTLLILAAFDLACGEHDRYSFRDLRACRRVGQLLRDGVALPDILGMAADLRRRGEDFARPELVGTPDGELMIRAGDYLSDGKGQLRLELGQRLDLETMFARAEELDEAGEVEAAERLYSLCIALAPRDPVPPYNLGNLLGRVGRTAEARVMLLRATALDRSFAEAWYNLGLLEARAGRPGEAEPAYRQAVAAAPSWSDPLYNLGIMLAEQERLPEAIDALERYLSLDPASRWSAKAKRVLGLCRIARTAAGRLEGSSPKDSSDRKTRSSPTAHPPAKGGGAEKS